MEDCDEFICGTILTKNSLVRSQSRDRVHSQVVVHFGADELKFIVSRSQIGDAYAVAFAVATEIKENAVALVESGRKFKEVARDLSISNWSLKNWIKLARVPTPDHPQQIWVGDITYIEGFFKRTRLYSALGYKSPVDFEYPRAISLLKEKAPPRFFEERLFACRYC